MTVEFDHRASIIAYLENQAIALRKADRTGDAAVLDAQIGSVKAQLDIEAGKRSVASPADIILQRVSAALYVHPADVVSASKQKRLVRARRASTWLMKRLLDWNLAQIGDVLRRDEDQMQSIITDAEKLRATDAEFLKLTDRLSHQSMVCEACLQPIQGN